MRSFLITLGLQAYAVFLALTQWRIGLRTDEAKYILDIPYPHPPLVRFVLHATDSLFSAEFFWRLLIATVIVQSVWMLVHVARRIDSRTVPLVVAIWLCSPALLLQGGTIMIAVFTAIQMLGFLILALLARRSPRPWMAPAIACLWLASLFTSYQAVLLLPLVWFALSHAHLPLFKRILCTFGPLALLALYSLANPLALASIVGFSDDHGGLGMAARVGGLVNLWMVAGGGIGGVIGLVGLVRSKHIGILLTFALIILYCLASHSPYYAILLLPFLAIGCMYVPLSYRSTRVMVISILVSSIFVSAPLFSELRQQINRARDTIALLQEENFSITTPMTIVGSFGHQWQYYSPYPVIRFTDGFESVPRQIVICIAECPAFLTAGLTQLKEDVFVDPMLIGS